MANFDFSTFCITRVIVHTIHERDDNKEPVAPTCSDSLMGLNIELTDLLEKRLQKSIGNASKGVEVGVIDTSNESFMQLAAAMIHAKDAEFIDKSKLLAERLTRSQASKDLPKSILIILHGDVGNDDDSRSFIAVIKAETDLGINLVENNHVLSLKIIKDMLLSESQKLYKVGLLLENKASQLDASSLYSKDDFDAFLFDQNIVADDRGKASGYFYKSFLGMTVFHGDDALTMRFLDETKKFINSTAVPHEDKPSLHEALRVELRSNSKVINVLDFANNHMPEEYREKYIQKMLSKDIPNRNIIKCKEAIKGKLRKPREYVMSSNVRVKMFPPKGEDLEDFVAIDRSSNEQTVITIKGDIKEEK